MYPFSTEFVVGDHKNKATFVAEVLAWLRGNRFSTILTNAQQSEFNRDYVHLIAVSGEELRLREFSSVEGIHAFGFRHDMPDKEGRIWRTECVLKNPSASNEQPVIRFKTQCLPGRLGAKLETPKKPYVIKNLLKSGWGGIDGSFPVSDVPIFLSEGEEDQERARIAFCGGDHRLPIVYVSSTGFMSWTLDRSDIDKLAYDLGGIAHVLVEPSKVFSQKLRPLVGGRNAYNGTIGLTTPQHGLLRRLFIGWDIHDKQELISEVREFTTFVRCQMQSAGWEWTDLQEQALKAQRISTKNELNPDEVEKLYLEEIANLSEKINELESRQLDAATLNFAEVANCTTPLCEMLKVTGPEIYDGELFDRVVFCIKETLSSADRLGLDKRSVAVFSKIVEFAKPSDDLEELLGEIKRATSDSKKLAASCASVLSRHGYMEKSDNKHVRLEPLSGYIGLDTITIAKTPSDHRGLANTKSQIENALGLTKIKKKN